MTSDRLIVHMIGNAHLDPAWLWTWPSGLDEALGTCRTACDLLDSYPELHVTRGEAWVYDRVAALDPALFRRIAAHVAGGRWHPVNGWWVQADCNQPGPESFRRQAAIGGKFFRDRLGVSVRTGYNVDSFGHCAMLPTFLREAGMTGYAFMRPNSSQMTLPAEAFRWRSPAGDEVVGFRIPRSYSAATENDLEVGIEAAIAAAVPGLGHTMAFYGVGDHGGGPTRAQIEWILEHQAYRPGVELRFSHPQAFFDAIGERAASLPCVEGELQHFAVGCYSSVRASKREVRRAEEMLLDAERLARAAGADGDAAVQSRLEEAWKRVLFNQFHDIMGGTCIQSAHVQASEELGLAKTVARDLSVELTRRANVALPPRRRQRMVLDNPSARAWRGLAEFEPWAPTDGSPRDFVLEDESGAVVPHQTLPSDCGLTTITRIAFPVEVPAESRCIVELRRKQNAPSAPSRVRVDGTTGIANERLRVTCGERGIAALAFDGRPLLGPEGLDVVVLDDLTDPWSTDLLRYEGRQLAVFAATQPWTVMEDGPLRAALGNTLRTPDATLDCVVRVAAGDPVVRLSLRLHWRGTGCIAKLRLPTAFRPVRRIDGTPGVLLPRPLDGKEYPVRDLVAVEGDSLCLAAISPDVSGADVQPDGTIRLTLVRSSYYGLLGPQRPRPLQPVMDQGVHEIELELHPGNAFEEETVLDAANRMNHPLWISETTQGMPAGWNYDRPARPDMQGVPVAPARAWLAEDLLPLLEEPRVASLADSRIVCEEWTGDRVLLAEEPVVRLRLAVPVDGCYRMAVGHGAGGVFGPVQIRIGGQCVATLADSCPCERGNVTVVPDALRLTAGEVTVAFERQAGTRMAIGFVDLAPVYRDIPSAAWTGIGPFLYGATGSLAALSGVDEATALKDVVLPPEQDIAAPVLLDDGTTLYWQPMGEDGDWVDFFRLTGHKNGSIHYAATRINAPTACRVRLSFGMDYWMRVWINGEAVVPFQEGVGAIIKGMFTFDAELRAGWNDVLVKLASGSGGNGFWLAVTDRDGQFEFIRPTVSPSHVGEAT